MAAIDIVAAAQAPIIDLAPAVAAPVVDVISPLIKLPAKQKRTAFVEPYNYLGKAIFSALETDPVWTITRLEISAAGTLVEKIIANNVAWTDYLTIN